MHLMKSELMRISAKGGVAAGGVDPPIQGAAAWSSICTSTYLLTPRVFIEVRKISCPEFVRIKVVHVGPRRIGAYAWPAQPAHKSSHSGYLYHFKHLDCSP